MRRAIKGLIASARSRRWFTWIVAGAVVAIAVVAGLDALRSSGDDPTASAERDRAVTTQAETGAEIESSASLIDEQLVRLIPGRVRTDKDWPGFDSFTVPLGWYGHQRGRDDVRPGLPFGE
jgi:hypothetical protein